MIHLRLPVATLLAMLLQSQPPPLPHTQDGPTPPAPAPASGRTSLAPGVSEAERGLETKLATLVDESAMQQWVRDLCRLGPRMGGTKSGHQSAEFLRARFEKLGLEVRVVEDPPRWCHAEKAWSVTARRVRAGAGTGSPPEAPRTLGSAWPYGFSPTSSGRAPLSKTPGAGVALLAENAPRRLEKGGAPLPAVVLVGGNTTLDGAYPRISHLREGADNPAAVFGLSRPDARWLEEALAAATAAGEALEIQWHLEAQIREAAPRTVVARLPGRARSAAPWTDEHFLFCAHGDSDAGGPGADDNASGMATLLGIATAWKQGIDQGLVPAPGREVRFAIWGSEIHSSRALLAREDQDGRVLGVLNYDQAGYGSGADQFNIEPDDLPANVPLVRTVVAVLADHGKQPGFPELWATNKSLGGTDSYIFSGSEAFRQSSRPALTLFTSAWDEPAEHPRTPGMPGESWRERDQVRVDFDNYYHSAGDTPENTTDKEPWNMGWCARIGLLSARRAVEEVARGK